MVDWHQAEVLAEEQGEVLIDEEDELQVEEEERRHAAAMQFSSSDELFEKQASPATPICDRVGFGLYKFVPCPAFPN